MKFYTVTAKFDTDASNAVEVKSFLMLENANKFALEQKQEFLDQISPESLDHSETEEYMHDGMFTYSARTYNHEHVLVLVSESTFSDAEVAVG